MIIMKYFFKSSCSHKSFKTTLILVFSRTIFKLFFIFKKVYEHIFWESFDEKTFFSNSMTGKSKFFNKNDKRVDIINICSEEDWGSEQKWGIVLLCECLFFL